MAKNDFVIIESPFAGEVKRNIRYARACARDCLIRGEIPFASHLFYTQTGILDDLIPEERQLGINAGLHIAEFATLTAVYTDLGITNGMKEYGIKGAKKVGRPIDYRKLGKDWESSFLERARDFPYLGLF